MCHSLHAKPQLGFRLPSKVIKVKVTKLDLSQHYRTGKCPIVSALTREFNQECSVGCLTANIGELIYRLSKPTQEIVATMDKGIIVEPFTAVMFRKED